MDCNNIMDIFICCLWKLHIVHKEFALSKIVLVIRSDTITNNPLFFYQMIQGKPTLMDIYTVPSSSRDVFQLPSNRPRTKEFLALFHPIYYITFYSLI